MRASRGDPEAGARRSDFGEVVDGPQARARFGRDHKRPARDAHPVRASGAGLRGGRAAVGPTSVSMSRAKARQRRESGGRSGSAYRADRPPGPDPAPHSRPPKEAARTGPGHRPAAGSTPEPASPRWSPWTSRTCVCPAASANCDCTERDGAHRAAQAPAAHRAGQMDRTAGGLAGPAPTARRCSSTAQADACPPPPPATSSPLSPRRPGSRTPPPPTSCATLSPLSSSVAIPYVSRHTGPVPPTRLPSVAAFQGTGETPAFGAILPSSSAAPASKPSGSTAAQPRPTRSRPWNTSPSTSNPSSHGKITPV